MFRLELAIIRWNKIVCDKLPCSLSWSCYGPCIVYVVLCVGWPLHSAVLCYRKKSDGVRSSESGGQAVVTSGFNNDIRGIHPVTDMIHHLSANSHLLKTFLPNSIHSQIMNAVNTAKQNLRIHKHTQNRSVLYHFLLLLWCFNFTYMQMDCSEFSHYWNKSARHSEIKW
jgi:hypothetical protein